MSSFDKIYDAICESFFDHAVLTGKYTQTGKREIVPVFLNPDSRELAGCGREWRGMILPDGNLYMVPEPYVHEVILHELFHHRKIGSAAIDNFYYVPDNGLLVQFHNGKVWLGESCVYAYSPTKEQKVMIKDMMNKCKEKNLLELMATPIYHG